jgi:uncharacterized protein involved in exopolysaccharide biosynthesis
MNFTQPQNTLRPSPPSEPASYHPAEPEGDDLDVLALLGAMWRGRWWFVGYTVAALSLAVYYAFAVATSYYASTGWLALQVQDAPVVDIQSVVSGVSTEAEAINTEIDIIKSRELLLQLVDEMDLVNDPEFNGLIRPEGMLSRKAIIGLISQYVPGFELDETPPSDEEIRLAVARSVADALTVRAKTNTYLYSISARTTSPAKSAELVNRLADIYIRDQVQVKFKATEFAVDWLAERVGELEIAVKDSEDAIKALRSETELTSFEALEALNIRSKDLRQRLEDTQRSAERLATRQQEVERHMANGDVVQAAAVLQDPRLIELAAAFDSGAARGQLQFNTRFERLKADLDAELQRIAAQAALLAPSEGFFVKPR